VYQSCSYCSCCCVFFSCDHSGMVENFFLRRVHSRTTWPRDAYSWGETWRFFPLVLLFSTWPIEKPATQNPPMPLTRRDVNPKIDDYFHRGVKTCAASRNRLS